MAFGKLMRQKRYQLTSTIIKLENLYNWHKGLFFIRDFFIDQDIRVFPNEIYYFDAAGNLNALRYKDWKLHFFGVTC